MITKRFDFNFRPLQINTSITTDGSVPDSQSYDADEDTYTPDYTVTPCAIMPRVSRIDRDGYLSAGAVNGDSANFSCKWSELINGKEQEIGTDNTNYQITTTWNNTGRILVKKNAKPGVPINLVFYCEYIDPRTKQIYRKVCYMSDNKYDYQKYELEYLIFGHCTDKVRSRIVLNF